MTTEYKQTPISALLGMDGYAQVQNVFSDEDLEDIKTETEALIEKWTRGEIIHEDFWNYKNEQNQDVLYRIHNFEKHYPNIYQIIEKPGFKCLVQDVFGVEVYPRVFALIIKPPNAGGEVPWHRDTDKIEPGEVFNFSIYLDDSFEENGCLEVIPETHKDNCDYSKITAPASGVVKVQTGKNGVIVHDVRLLHGSGNSRSPHLRRSVVIEFNKK